MAVKSSTLATITIPNNFRVNLLEYLQRSEIAEIIEPTTPSTLDTESEQIQSELIEKLDIVNQTLDIYRSLRPKKPSLLASLLDTRRVISEKTFDHYDSIQDDILEQAQAVYDMHLQQTKLTEKQQILADVIAKSEPLKDIEIDIFQPYHYVEFIPFLVDENRKQHILDQLESQFTPIVVESVKKIGTDYVYILAIDKSVAKPAHELLHNQTTIITFPTEVTGSFYDIYHKAITEYQENTAKLKELHTEIANHKLRYRDLVILSDVLQSQVDLINHLHYFESLNESQSTLRIWIDDKDISKLKATLTRSLKSSYSIAIIPMESNEDIPVIVSNAPILNAFESVTKIMGIPLGGSIDPTPYIAFFFIFMFGLALSEAGYALLLIFATASLLLHPRLKRSFRPMFTVIFLSSISTLIVGALFGSWFGVVPDDVVLENALPHMQLLNSLGILSFLQRLQIMNPMNNVVSLMIFTAVLGIIHLVLGLVLSIVQSIQKQSFRSQGVDSLVWLIALLAGVLLLIANQGLLGSLAQTIAEQAQIVYMVYIFIMVIVLGREMKSIPVKIIKGLYDVFFGAIGYLSDILSYTRLVALGLATGIIASVIGTLAVLAGGGLVERGGVSVIIGYIIMVIIFILGHTFNIALNVLGTYISVGRLHFVEFFSKFFESGGRELKRFKRSQHYSVIVE